MKKMMKMNKINCPYCRNGMDSGRIEAHNLLQWIPDGERTDGFTKWAKSLHSIVLAEYYLLAPAAVPAYYCGKCKKIVIDMRQSNAKG